MKKCVAGVIGIIALFISTNSIAQQSELVTNTIKPYTIAISCNKTTNLIFPYAIKSVDRGSGDVLVQKAKGVDNILQLKAGKENFEQTNLSLITADGKFYSFMLDFASQPSVLNVCFDKEAIAMIAGQTSEEALSKEATQVLEQYRFLRLRKNDHLLQIELFGIYLSPHAVWLKLRLKNHSQLDFQPEYVRFFLRDKRQSKRTAIQETEIFPIYTNANEEVKGSKSAIWTTAFPSFSVPDHQFLILQMSDKSGGRTIELKIKSNTLLRARQLR